MEPTVNKHDWATKFMKELKQELEARCNHGVTIFRHHNMWSKTVPHYSVTVRGKTIWLEFKLWKDGKKPNFYSDQAKMMDKLWTAFYVHLVINAGKFDGVSVNREEATYLVGTDSLGDSVRYLCTFFDLDTTELDY